MKDYNQIADHYNNTFGIFAAQNPQFNLYCRINMSFTFEKVSSGIANYATINIFYGNIERPIILPFKEALNSYFKPLLKNNESIKHLFNCFNKRTVFYSILINSDFGKGDYDVPLVSLQNKDLEMAISIFFQNQKVNF